MRTTPALEFDEVRHAYGDLVAIDAFDLKVYAGEVVCLLGPSGCGKTTALRVAAGLERLQAGRVRVGGRIVAENGFDVPPEQRGMGLVFQDFALFPHLTVAENIAFGLDRVSAAKRTERARAALEQVGMSELGERFPHKLSGGQQQRVALARALAPPPPVILLDEPFSGLDARLRDQIRDETLHILKNSGTATLMVTHDAEEAMFMADRIAVMRAGRIAQDDVPESLYCDPHSAFVAEFFGEVNRLNGIVQGGLIDTPLGSIEAPEMADGVSAEVLIRPEALRLSRPNAGDIPGARVIAARMLGRSSLVHLCLCRLAGEELHMHSRMPGRFLPKEDELLSVELDRSQTFVFDDNIG